MIAQLIKNESIFALLPLKAKLSRNTGVVKGSRSSEV